MNRGDGVALLELLIFAALAAVVLYQLYAVLGRRVGRQAEDGRRELILSRGRFGYIAKYRWVPSEDVVLILAVRHQLEAGYREE